MGLRSLSRHRLRGRGTASAVEGANFALLWNFCVRCSVKTAGIDLTPTEKACIISNMNIMLQVKSP